MTTGQHAAAGTVLKAASVSFAGQLYQLIISLISGLVIARLIGPAPFGLFNLARTLCESTVLVTKVGFDVAIVRYLGERTGQLADAETVAVCRRVLLAVGVTSLIPIALVVAGGGAWLEQRVYPYEQFALVLAAMSLVIPFMSLLQVLGGIFRGFLRIAPRVIAELCAQPTLRLLTFLALFLIGWRLWAVVWATVASFLVAAVILLIWAFRGILRNPSESPPVTRGLWRKVTSVARYSVVISATVLMATLMSRMDVMLLGYFVSAESLGQYAIAQMIAGLLATFNIALSQAAAPMIADLGKRGVRSELATVLHQHARWVLATTLPLFFVLVLYGDALLPVLGQSYVSDVPILSVLALSQLATALFSSAGYTLSMTGRHTAEFYVMAIGAAATLALNLLLIPRQGLLGAAVATLCGVLVANGLRAVLVARVYGVFPVGRDALRSAVVCIVVFMGLFWLQKQLDASIGPAGALAWIGMSLVAYVAAMLAFGLTAGDRNLLIGLVSRIRATSRQ